MPTAENENRRLAGKLAADEVYHILDEYEIDRRRLVFISNDEKHFGGFGIIRMAHLRPSSNLPSYLPSWLISRRSGQAQAQPQVVAVKELRLSSIDDASELKRDFTKEILVWSRLTRHPGIVKFLGFCADFSRKEAWIISSWEPHGTVNEFIREHELQVPEKFSLAYDTLDALVFLHQLDPPVFHGDIKSLNVLVNAKYRAVLCDFGLARAHEDVGLGNLGPSETFKGSLRWCSPELFNGEPRTASSDIYAWAWLVWEIMTGEYPYEEITMDYRIIHQIFQDPVPKINGESRFSEYLQLWELMTRCWAFEPLRRPTSAMCKTTFEYLPHYPPTLKAADPHTRSAVLLENLGELESWKGDHKAGFAYLERALHLYQEEGNDKGIVSVLRKQAIVASRDSNHVRVMNAASAAVEKCRILQDDIGIAASLLQIGVSFLMDNKIVDALPNLQESLKILRVNGDSVDLARCLERLGETYRRQGWIKKALSTLEEAIDVASRCGDRLGEARVLTTLGVTRWNLNHLEQAISTLHKAQEISRSVGWEPGLSTCLCRLGSIKLQQGFCLEATELLHESVRVARKSNAGWRLGQALTVLGECLRTARLFREAISALEESCSVYQNHNVNFRSLASASALLAQSKLDLGSKDDALASYDRAIVEWRKGGDNGGDKVEMSKCLAAKGAILADMNRCDEGALHLEASLIIGQELHDKGLAGWSRNKLSGIPKSMVQWEVEAQVVTV